jgi:hypothetical protein
VARTLDNEFEGMSGKENVKVTNPNHPIEGKKIYVSFAPEDINYYKTFRENLQNTVTGANILVEILNHVETEAQEYSMLQMWQHVSDADAVVLMVSSHSLASELITQEVDLTLKMFYEGWKKVFPIILDRCDWEKSSLGWINTPITTPISSEDDESEAWYHINVAICKLLNSNDLEVQRIGAIDERNQLKSRVKSIQEQLCWRGIYDGLQDGHWRRVTNRLDMGEFQTIEAFFDFFETQLNVWRRTYKPIKVHVENCNLGGMIEQVLDFWGIFPTYGTQSFEALDSSGIGSSDDTKIVDADLIVMGIEPQFLQSEVFDLLIGIVIAGNKRVLPIVLEPCKWQDSPLKEYETIPFDGSSFETTRNAESFQSMLIGNFASSF